jgi:hypothetical protein
MTTTLSLNRPVPSHCVNVGHSLIIITRAEAVYTNLASAGNPSMKAIGADSTDGAEADGNDSVLSVSDRDSDAGNNDNLSASDDGLKGDSLQINVRLLSEVLLIFIAKTLC